MIFLRKSLLRKLFFDLFLFSLLIAALFFLQFKQGQNLIPFYYLPISLVILLTIFIFFLLWDVVLPLKKILFQMQSLLTGRPYKKIFTTRIDEIGIMAHFFNQVTSGLGKFSSQIQDRNRIKNELEVAAELQRDILPTASPAVPGLHIVAKNRPATELGGDIFGFLTVNEKTFIYIGDVTGHGVAAGLIMTMVNSLINVFANLYDSPYEIMVKVNKYIKNHVKKAMFMTMIMMCWDHQKKILVYVGAGHEHILVYRALKGECEKILSGGIALGMVADNSKLISEKNIELAQDDLVVLYSDGIIEARNDKNELYGLDRLTQSVNEFAPQYTATGINFHVAQDVSSYMQSHVQDDDMTLIVIKRSDEISSGEATNW